MVLKHGSAKGSKRDQPLFSIPQDTTNSIQFAKTGTTFDFNKVFSEYSSADLFDATSRELVDKLLMSGKDSLLFTLGPTNSGKTYLMLENGDDSLVNQTLSYLFEQLEGQLTDNLRENKNVLGDYPIIENCTELLEDSPSNVKRAITISMFEIHLDKTKDLLLQSTKAANQRDLGIITDPIDKKLRPHHMTRSLVNTYQSAKDLISRGLLSRSTSSTNINMCSSRSHCFIFIDLHELVGVNQRFTHRLTLADLAGLERSGTSMTKGKAFKETNYTNKSMTSLGAALEGYARGTLNKTTIRETKLTRLLFTDFQNNNSPLSLIVSLDPYGDQSLVHQTLKYIDPLKSQEMVKKSKEIDNNNIAHMKNYRPSSVNSEEMYAIMKHNEYLKNEIHNKETEIRSSLTKKHQDSINNQALIHQDYVQKLKNDWDTELNSKIDELTKIHSSKMETLNETLENVRNESSVLKQELDDVSRDKSVLEENFTEKEQEFLSKISKLEEDIQLANNQSNEDQQEVDLLKLEVQELKNELDELNSQIGQKDAKISTLTEQLDEKSQAFDLLQQEKSAIQVSIEKFQATIGERDGSIAKLEQTILERDSQIKLLEGDIANSKTDISKKELELEFLNERIDSMSASESESLSKLEADLKNEQKRVRLLEEMKTQLETQISSDAQSHTQAVESLKLDYDLQMKKLESFHGQDDTERLVSYEKTINELYEEVECQSAELYGYQTELEDLQAHSNMLELRLEEESRKSIEQSEQLAKFTSEIEQLKSQNESEKKKSDSQYNELLDQLRVSKEKSDKFIQDIKQLNESMKNQELKHAEELRKKTEELNQLSILVSSNKRKSLSGSNNILDMDMSAPIIPDSHLLSSPLKETFEIHQDEPATPIRSPKKAKAKRQHSDLSASGKRSKSASNTPKRNPLANWTTSSLNRKETLDKLLEKKRKSNSPLKNKHKQQKIRAEIDDSFEKLH